MQSSRPAVTRLLTLAACVWLERRGGKVYTEVPLVCGNGGRVPPPLRHPDAPPEGTPDYRLDVLHLGRNITTAIEVKSCRADFTGDAKLASYLGRVGELYVLTLPGVLRPDELPAGCGLLELNPQWNETPRSTADLMARLSDPFEVSAEDAAAEAAAQGDLIKVRRFATACELSERAELELLRGATSRVPLLEGARAMRQRREHLEQLLWLDREKAA